MINEISGITIKSNKEIGLMKEAGSIVAEIMKKIRTYIAPEVTTLELDKIADNEMRKHKVHSAFLGLYGFPATICVSINDEIVHGIPSKRRLKEGDIVSIDAGVIVNGFNSDHAVTFPVGKCSEQDIDLIRTTSLSLDLAIEKCKNGNFTGDLGSTIETCVLGNGYGLVRNYTGHGIGKNLHEPPQIPNYGEPKSGIQLVNGMTIAVEPMVNIGSEKTKLCDDGWTVVTSDGSRSAHFEHTILITDGDPEVLTVC